MHIYSKLGLFILVVGCVPYQGGLSNDASYLSDTFDVCKVGSLCNLEGKLYVHRGVPVSVAELRLPTECYALLLPESTFPFWARKQGIAVHIKGRAYSQSYAPGVISVAVLDRQMATGFCGDNPAIYVDDIRKITAPRR